MLLDPVADERGDGDRSESDLYVLLELLALLAVHDGLEHFVLPFKYDKPLPRDWGLGGTAI